MTFVSFPFIIFIAAVALVYFLVPKRFQWIVLLAASYLFYFLNSEWLILLLFATTFVTFMVGRKIGAMQDAGNAAIEAAGLAGKAKKEARSKNKRKTLHVLWIGVAFDLGMLLFLKYFNFFAGNANIILKHFGWTFPKLHLLLPLGISFYTLQAMAYMIDIYRGKIRPDTNLAKFMLFMSYFPQIVQGPFARYRHLANQLYESHSFDYRRMAFGAQLILWGFMKKTIIADRLAVPVEYVFNHSGNYTGLIMFLAVAGYGLQVYADFSGGMEIARGVSQILGIEIELNFRQPYFSNSIEDFWRRWHITLGAWMKDYIFYPLSLSKSFAGVSRVTRKIAGNYIGKKIPAFLSMFVVYFLVGFWHGSEWKYIVYGVWNGCFIMTGILLTDVYAKMRAVTGVEGKISWTVFQVIRTFIIRSIGLFFARAKGVHQALSMMTAMTVKWWDLSFLTQGTLKSLGLDNANWILVITAIIILFAVDYLHEKEVPIRETIAAQPIVFRWIIYYGAIIAVLIFGIYGPSYDSAAFIYEQF